MNINLLPNKFIRNRAFEVIFFTAIAALVGVVVLALIGYFTYQIQANNYRKSVNTAQVEKRLLEQKVAKLSASKSETLQSFILKQKKEILLIEPIMTTFEQKATSVAATILSYNVTIPDTFTEEAGTVSEETENQAQDGSELLPTVTMMVQGPLYESLVKLKSTFETIDWVYDVQYKTNTTEETPAHAEITLRLLKEKVPRESAKENSHD